MKFSLSDIPSGRAGTDATVAQMITLVKSGLSNPRIRLAALDIIQAAGVDRKDYAGEISAIYWWVANNIRYTRDPYKLEMIHAPDVLLYLRYGDCDDIGILMASLLQSIGFETRFKVIASKDRNFFNHIYIEALLDGQWLPLDATVPEGGPGWESPIIYDQKTYSLEGNYMYENELGATTSIVKNSPGAVAALPGEIMMPHIEAFLRADMKELLQKRAVSRDELTEQLKYLMSSQAKADLSPVQIDPAKTVIIEAIRVIDATPGYKQEITLAGLAGLDDLGFNLFKSIGKAIKSAVKLVAPVVGLIPGVGPIAQKVINAGIKLVSGPAKAATAPQVTITNPPGTAPQYPEVKVAVPPETSATSGAAGFSLSSILSNPLYLIGGVAVAAGGIYLVTRKRGRR